MMHIVIASLVAFLHIAQGTSTLFFADGELLKLAMQT